MGGSPRWCTPAAPAHRPVFSMDTPWARMPSIVSSSLRMRACRYRREPSCFEPCCERRDRVGESGHLVTSQLRHEMLADP